MAKGAGNQDQVQDQAANEPVTEPENNNEQVPESAEVQAEAAKRQKTLYAGKDFDLGAVDELPENEPATRGRDRVYFELLESVAADNDNLSKWHPIARFATPNGAVTTSNQLIKQMKGMVLTEEQSDMKAADRPAEVKGFIPFGVAREVPEYEGWVWDFAARRVPSQAPDAKPGDRESLLFARLVEDGSATWQTDATAGDGDTE